LPTYPEQLYQSLDEALIDRFITEQQEEHLHLDFKAARDTSLRDNRANLAIALSGFANADGGVIIWGVDARRNPQGVDCAGGRLPVRSLADLLSHLNEFTGQAVNPTVDGVVHRGIRTGTDEGFAVTLVPASDAGPHMAKFGEDRYYKRVGSRFAKMEHYEVADMFGRRARPLLELRCDGIRTQGSAEPSCYFALTLSNKGRGSARAPMIDMDTVPGYSIGSGAGILARAGDALARYVSRHPDQTAMRLIGYNDFIIHPGTEYEIARIVLNVTVRPDRPPPRMHASCRVAAENYPLTPFEFEFLSEAVSAILLDTRL
jgi:hypothetical protein